jgi:pilus assembly protein Flp/PilA
MTDRMNEIMLTKPTPIPRQAIIPMENIMRRFMQYLAAKRFIASEEGVTAIEYGLIAALVAIVIIAGVTLLGTNLSASFANIAGKV